MTQLVVASTFYQCLSLAAAADAGRLPATEGERILVLANSSQVPELSAPLSEQAGFDSVVARFDRWVDLAALVYPRRPVQFSPRRVELGIWERLLRSSWSLGSGPMQILMDSVQVNPALALAEIFHDADLYAHSDGLMTYSPTRSVLPLPIAARMRGLIYIDLVPGLVPALLSELEVERIPVPRSVLRSVLTAIATSTTGPRTTSDPVPRSALLLGQYLPSLGLLSRADEAALHRSMLIEAAEAGIDRCVFKPHPSAPPTSVLDLERDAAELGVQLVVDESATVAELVIARDRPDLVLSCFSTGLATAAFVLGTQARAVGTEHLMKDLSPYENSNRVPVVIADALFGAEHVDDLAALVDAVVYCMQPGQLRELRGPASAYLEQLVVTDPHLVRRYFKRKRLTRLDLPGRWPRPAPVPPAVPTPEPAAPVLTEPAPTGTITGGTSTTRRPVGAARWALGARWRSRTRPTR